MVSARNTDILVSAYVLGRGEGRGGGGTPDQLKTDCAKLCPNLHFLVWGCGGGGLFRPTFLKYLGEGTQEILNQILNHFR